MKRKEGGERERRRTRKKRKKGKKTLRKKKAKKMKTKGGRWKLTYDGLGGGTIIGSQWIIVS